MAATTSTTKTVEEKTPQLLNKDLAVAMLDQVDFITSDVDGVLWSGDAVTEQARETIRWLKEVKKKQVRFITNNSSKSRRETLELFHKNGFTDTRFEDVYSSGYAAGQLLRRKLMGSGKTPYNKNVFVLGNLGLVEEVELALDEDCFAYGLELNITTDTKVQPDLLNPFMYNPKSVAHCADKPLLPPPRKWLAKNKDQEPVTLDKLNIGAVIVGTDYSANMTKMALASVLAANPEVPFIALNTDPQISIGERPLFFPGTGAIVSFISTAIGRKPDAVCGKPETLLMDVLCENEDISDRSKILMIGDRLTSDIEFGNTSGTHTMFVLSGCEKVEDIERVGIKPDLISPTISSLMQFVVAEGK